MNEDLISAESLSTPAPHDAPIVALIGKSPADMNDKELDDHLRKLRELRGSAPTKRAVLKPTKETKEKNIDWKKLL